MAEGQWTDVELAATVVAYRRIQELEIRGVEYSKTEIRDEMIGSLFLRRTAGSYEYRMQNISAVLDELGQPWIEGYKPARNVGEAVRVRLGLMLDAIRPGGLI